jgi:hypothetical protein
MTTEQQQTYRAMKMVRRAMNGEGSDRHTLSLELERLRRSLGGMQYAETPDEGRHKNYLHGRN